MRKNDSLGRPRCTAAVNDVVRIAIGNLSFRRLGLTGLSQILIALKSQDARGTGNDEAFVRNIPQIRLEGG